MIYNVFEIKSFCIDTGSLMGFQCSQSPKLDEIETSMNKYIATNESLQVPSMFHELNSNRLKISWVVHTGPDVACFIIKALQATEERYDPKQDAKLLNKVLYHLRKYSLKHKSPKLYLKSLHIKPYADASDSGNCDLTFQLVLLWYYVICLVLVLSLGTTQPTANYHKRTIT